MLDRFERATVLQRYRENDRGIARCGLGTAARLSCGLEDFCERAIGSAADARDEASPVAFEFGDFVPAAIREAVTPAHVRPLFESPARSFLKRRSREERRFHF